MCQTIKSSTGKIISKLLDDSLGKLTANFLAELLRSEKIERNYLSSLMLASDGVRKEVKLCLSCRTCGDRDYANYTHPHSPCMSRTIRVNVVSSTNGSTSRSRSGGVSVMEIDINLTSAGKVIKVSRLQHDQPLYLVLYPTASLNLLGYEKFMAGVFF